MRRLTSLVLFLCFSFGLVSPLLALGSLSDVNLPACCRRNGVHECMKQMHEMPANGAGVATMRQKCPNCPGGPDSVKHDQVADEAAALIFGEVVSHPAMRAQTLAWARVALAGAQQQRGPPAGLKA